MKRAISGALFVAALLLLPLSAQNKPRRVYLCRSPLLAIDFWNSLLNIQKQGVTLTPQIAQQVCEGMKAGSESQCISVEVGEFKPIASGSDGALALTDGKTKIWFHHPDTGGWVASGYYVYLVNSK